MVQDSLLNDVMTNDSKAFLIAISEVAPSLLIIILAPYINVFGSYKIIKFLILSKIVAALVMGITGRSWIIVLLLYIFANRTLTICTFGLFNLPVSDLIDEDLVTHQRQKPLSSLYFGLNALFTKPAHSIAPVFVVNILSRYGYRQQSTSTFESDPLLASSADSEVLRDVMFVLLTLFPFLSGCLQMAIWHFGFTLHSHKLHKVKDRLAKQRESQNDNTDGSYEMQPTTSFLSTNPTDSTDSTDITYTTNTTSRVSVHNNI